MYLYGLTYDYQHNSRFYDSEHDFSTHVKFYHVPGVKLIEFLPNIEKHIILKKNSPKKYLAFISIATIQLEGIFYDLTCIKFGKNAREL